MLRINPCYPLIAHPQGTPPYIMNAVGEGYDVAFAADTADPITSLGFCRMRPIGNPGAYRLSIQGVNRTNFQADGVEVAGVDIVSDPLLPAGAGDPTALLWHDLPTPVSLTPGGFYTFVYRAVSGTWDGSNYERIYPFTYWPSATSYWPFLTTHQNGGSVSRGSVTPIYAYRTASRVYGRPQFYTVGGLATLSGNYYDLSAKYTGITAKLASVATIYLKNNTATVGTVEMQLRVDPLGSNTLVATSTEAFLEPNYPITGAGYRRQFQFLDPPEIDLGKPFSVVMNSKHTGGTAVAQLHILVDSKESWMPYDEEDGITIAWMQGDPPTPFNVKARAPIELNLIDLRGTFRQTAFSPYLSGHA